MITNYGEYLERHPPTHEAQIWERSSWSCAHGVERWNSNCGCNSKGTNWNQEWRLPLRETFDWLRDTIAAPFETKAREIFRDPWAARNEYIHVILNRSKANVDKFFNEQGNRGLTEEDKITGLKLMEMQRHAMLMYTSCGWFFDELSGIETTQVIQYAARTLQLYERIFRASIEPMFLSRLAAAKSNIPEHQDGRVIYEKFVRPAMIDRPKVAAHYGLISLFRPYPAEAKIYCYTVRLEDFERLESGRAKLVIGRVNIASEITQDTKVYSFGALRIGDQLVNCSVHKYEREENYGALKETLTSPFERGDFQEVVGILDQYFGQSTYSLQSIFHDDQRKILNVILQSKLAEAEAVYRQMYKTLAPTMRFVSDLGVPLPRPFSIAAEFALNSSLRAAFEDVENLDFERIRSLIDEAHSQSVSLDGATLAFALRNTIKQLSERFLANPADLELMKKLEGAAGLARRLPFEVNVWRAQNQFYQMLQTVYPERVRNAVEGDAASQEWITHFVALGKNLDVRVEMPMPEETKLAS
jgi:hypothetical protein